MKKYYTKTYRPLLQGVVDKCEDEFEKKLIYIASGALGLSFAFVSDIVNINDSYCRWMLLSGWGLLILCICINCFSHLWSKKYAKATIDDIDSESEKDYFDDKDLRDKIDRRNKKTNRTNALTIWLMTGGIVFIVTYAAVNILRSNHELNNTEQTKTHNNMKDFENTKSICTHEGQDKLSYSMPKPAVHSQDIQKGIELPVPEPQGQFQSSDNTGANRE